MASEQRFFGYGSLVNLRTHAYPEPRPATLSGWRRIWCRTTLRDVAFLSVTSDASVDIDGIVASVPNADWAALDDRERAYARHPADTTAGRAQVYAVADQNLSQCGEVIILLSYLDVVVQGYLRQFGEDGVARFFQTTTGWGARIRDDRADPIYPRAQRLTRGETQLVDEWLAKVTKRASTSM